MPVENSTNFLTPYSQNYSCTTKVPTFNCGIIVTQYDMSLYYRKAYNTELLEKRMRGSDCEK